VIDPPVSVNILIIDKPDIFTLNIYRSANGLYQIINKNSIKRLNIYINMNVVILDFDFHVMYTLKYRSAI